MTWKGCEAQSRPLILAEQISFWSKAISAKWANTHPGQYLIEACNGSLQDYQASLTLPGPAQLTLGRCLVTDLCAGNDATATCRHNLTE